MPELGTVFISHAGEDKAAASRFAQVLESHGVEVWLDASDLRGGEVWAHSIEEALKKLSAMVVYVGELGVKGWMDLEVRAGLEKIAHNRDGYRVIPVFGKGVQADKLPLFLRQFHAISAEDPDAIHELLDLLGVQPAAVPSGYWVEHSPFRSLQPFSIEDAWLFFGRETETQGLVDRLRQAPVTMVIGNSGVGKSSLLRAGVAPALQVATYTATASAVWRVAILRPSAEPFTELAESMPGQLAPQLPAAERMRLIEQWRGKPRQGPEVLQNMIAALAREGEHTALIVDQFEELFTLTRDRAVHRDYIAAVLGAARVESSRPIHVILGLQSDFHPNCLEYPELKQYLDGNTAPLYPMAPEQLRVAIERRLAIAHCHAEDGLVETLLADAEQEPGSLPLLEHALSQLWDRDAAKGVLTSASYREIGGLRLALERHADRVFAEIAERFPGDLCRKVFVELVHLGDGGKDTRRRVSKELLHRLGNPPAVDHLISLLAAKRLVTTSIGGPDGNQAFVEVSHEALIRQWARLRKWVDDDRETIRFRRRIEEDAEDWSKSRDAGALLRGGRLVRASELAVGNNSLTDPANSFVVASRAQEQIEERREVDRALQKARTARRFLLVSTALLAAALGFAWFAFRQKGLAESRTRLADSRRLVAESVEMVARDQPSALSAALQAWQLAPIQEAREAVSRAFPVLLLTLPHQAGFGVRATFSPDRNFVLTYASDNSARVWDTNTGALVQTLSAHTRPVVSAAFSPDGSRIATGGSDNTIRVWDWAAGQTLLVIEGNKFQSPMMKIAGPNGSFNAVSFSPDGKCLLSGGGGDSVVQVWGAFTGEQLKIFRPESSFVTGAQFSADGRRAAVAVGPMALVWDIDAGRFVGIKPDGRQVISVSLSPNGSMFVAASAGNAAYIYEASRAQLLAKLTGHTGAVRTAVYSPDGSMILTASADNTARLWDAANGKVLAIFGGHAKGVLSAAFSKDGEFVVTGSADGFARIWSLTSIRMVKKFEDSGGLSAIFSPRGDQVAAGGDMVRLWNLASGSLVRRFEIPTTFDAMVADGMNMKPGKLGPNLAQTLTFSRDGSRIAAGCFSSIRIWETATGKLVRELKDSTISWLFASLSPDGRQVLSCARDIAVLFDVNTGQVIRYFGGAGHVDRALFSPDGKRILTEGEDRIERIWDAVSARTVFMLRGCHDVAAVRGTFSPDGNHVATFGADRTVCVWSALSGQPELRLKGHSTFVTSVGFSQDSQLLATSSDDGTARLWDTSGRWVTSIDFHTQQISSVAFAPNGPLILAAGSDRTARLFQLFRLSDLRATLGL